MVVALDDVEGYERGQLHVRGQQVIADHPVLGRMFLTADAAARPIVCDNDTNTARLFGLDPGGGDTPVFPTDRIGDHVIHGRASINPDGVGTKAAFWHHLSVASGQTVERRLRLSRKKVGIDKSWLATMRDREADSEEFYAALTPATVDTEQAMVMRRAFAGMLWSKQFFHYDVERRLDLDPTGPPPPDRRKNGTNKEWRHLNNADVISMPDTWEYPWYATWDLAFHCVALAHVDPDFAKRQLLMMCREWFMHPNGQLPAYEWAFGDLRPPVHAWAALRVFEIDGGADYAFLERIMHKLLLNFTCWVNRKDAEGNNVFQGGFSGLDNIGPIDRSAQLPVAGVLEQADGTAWMAMYCLNLLEMSMVLSEHDDTYEDLASKFYEHFAYIASALHDRGLWDEEDGFYYDVLRHASGERQLVRARSMVGLLPLAATTTLGRATLNKLPRFAANLRSFERHKPQFARNIMHTHELGGSEGSAAGGRLPGSHGPPAPAHAR